MYQRLQSIPTGFEPVAARALPLKKREITKDAFDSLLEWLHPDREEAGRIYEQIRHRLIRVFAGRGCTVPEELADAAIDRVLRKVRLVIPDYRGDPALYFYGVARNIWREYTTTRTLPAAPPPPAPAEDEQAALDCLEECISHLQAKYHDLVVQYYQETGEAGIAHRKELARRCGFDMNALRIRMHRVRSVLGGCVSTCLQREQLARS